MKLYMTQFIGLGALYRAADNASMHVTNAKQHGSRYADIARVIEFNGSGGAIRSTRRPNWGYVTDEYAATWDQWGLLLSDLFYLDPKMKVGGYKHPYYRNADDFHFQTGDRFKRRFRVEDLPDFHGDHSWQIGVPHEQTCRKCSAVKRWEA